MPELPEVETIARQLRALVVDRTISDFESRWIRLTEPEPAEHMAARLRGRRITGVRRRGKFVLFDLDGGESLVVSLRMTGKLLYGVDDVDERYVRAEIQFADGTALRFSDTRKFGRMALVDAATLAANGKPRGAKPPLHASLGQEPGGFESLAQALAQILLGLVEKSGGNFLAANLKQQRRCALRFHAGWPSRIRGTSGTCSSRSA